MENGISPYIAKVSLARRLTSAIAAFIVAIALFTGSAVQAQTYVPPGPGQDWNSNPVGEDLSQGANNTDATSRYIYDQPGQTTLVREQAEQNTDAVAQNVEAKLWPAFGSYNDTYEGLAAFWGDDIISNFFANIGQIIGKWLSEFINGWVADAVQFLTGFLRIFVLNPNIATNGLAASGGPADDISPYIRQGADIMYGIAVDLLLLLFILCIWKYWAEAAWRGGGNLMGAVGRLIFTAGLMLAWPTIYAFEIQISNEMIRAIYFNSADQVAMLDAAMAAAVKAGLVAGAGLLANATAPVAGQVFGGLLGAGPGGLILGTVGSLVAFVGLILYLIVGGVLIAQLVYILVLKAIQTGLLCAQYMFAPIFLVFFATPDTENVTSGFVRSFVEVSLWTFVWVGLLKIMVIVVLSNFNPWGKIVMAIGVLQIMIQVPSFLARAQISPMSDFISAGLITGGLLSAGKALTNGLGHRAMHLANAIGNYGYAGAKGSPKSQNVDLNVPQGVNNDELLKNKREAERTGKVPGQGPDNPGGQPLNPIGPKGPKTGPDGTKLDKDGNPIPPTGKGINPLTGKPDGTGVGPEGTKKGQDAALNPTGAKGDGTTIPTPPKTGKEGTLANAAADAAKTGLGTAAVAAGLGTAMAAAQAPGLTGGQTPGSKDEQGRQADLSAQQAAEALKALKEQNNAGPNAAAKGAANPDSKDLKSATAVPGAKDANSKLEGKEGAGTGTGVDAKLQEKGKEGSTAANAATAAAAAAAAANVGKDLKPGDLANALPKGADKTNPGATGGKNAEMDVEVERDPASTAGSAAAAAAALNSLKSGGTEGGVKGAGTGVTGPDAAGQKTSLKAPGAEGANGQVTTDVKGNLVSKPGESPNKDGKPVVPPAASAALGDAAKNISRGAADPTTVAVNSDVAPDGDPGAPLQQVRGNALNTSTSGGKADQSVTPASGLDAKDVVTSAANAGANLAAGKLNQQGATNVDARLANQGGKVSTTGVNPGADANANLTGNLNQTPGNGQQVVSPSGIPPLGGVNVTADGTSLEGADATLNPGRTTANITNTAAGNNQAVVTPNAGLNAGDIASAAAGGAGLVSAANRLGQQSAINVDARLAGQTRVNPTGVNVGGDQNSNLSTQINPTTGQPVISTGAGMPQVGGVNVTPDGASLEGADATLTPGRTAATINNSATVNAQTVQPQTGLNPGDIAGAAVAGAGIVAAANKLGQQASGTVDARLNNQGRVNTTVTPGGGDLNANVQAPVSVSGANVSGIPAVPPSAFNVSSVDGGQEVDASGMQGRTSATIQNTAQPGTVQQQQAGINPNDIAAGVAGVNSAANAGRQGQQSRQSVDARLVGSGRTGNQTGPAAPETIFTQAQVGGGGNNGGQPPARFTTMDGGDGGDDGSGGNGGGFSSGGTVPPANGPNRGGAPTPPPSNPDVIEGFNQAGYNKVPMRVAAANIRLAQGATIGRSGTGSNYAVYDSQGHVMHYRFDENATPEQKAMGIMAGSYGELMSSDAEAYDAARVSAIEAGEHKPQGAMERIAAGILAYNGGSWTQTAAAKQRFARSMAKHAAIGSQAYISGEKGNAYTEFLENRYGVMDDDRQAEAVHIMTTDQTPESGWSWRLQPATEALIQNGIQISPLNRACAANMAVLKAQPWLRGAAIRGSAAYIDSKANAAIPDGTHSMVRDSWYAHHAEAMTPEVVNCVGALTLATGDVEVCRNAPLIDQVVSMVPVGGRPEDYVGAYNSLQTGTAVVQRLVAPSGGGGGGGGSFNMGSQSVSSSGGNVNMGAGTVSTSVSGSVVGGGGGYNNAEMDILMDPPSQSQAMPNINPGSLNVGNVQMPGNATNVNVRTHTNAAGGQNLGSMSVRLPGQNVGSSQGQVQIGSVQNMGGGQGGTDNVTVDVEIGDSGAPGSNYADVQAAAVSAALRESGSAPELIKNVVADLKATGMSWQDIQNPNLMATAIQSYSTNPNSLPQVAIASNAMGADHVTTADVQIVQDMQDADPRWDARSIDYGAVYTSQCIVEAHMADPQAYGQPYLTKDYVDKVRLDPRFRPRAVPRRGANGQVGFAERTLVPSDVILNHLQDQMRRFGGGGGGDRY